MSSELRAVAPVLWGLAALGVVLFLLGVDGAINMAIGVGLAASVWSLASWLNPP